MKYFGTQLDELSPRGAKGRVMREGEGKKGEDGPRQEAKARTLVDAEGVDGLVDLHRKGRGRH